VIAEAIRGERVIGLRGNFSSPPHPSDGYDLRRRHWGYLCERRTDAELEALLAEALADLRRRRVVVA
jgi:hypothetical protein